MCFDPNPLARQLDLENLEARYLAPGFDHSKPPLSGWRAERQEAFFTAQTRPRSGGAVPDRPVTSWRFGAIFRFLFC